MTEDFKKRQAMIGKLNTVKQMFTNSFPTVQDLILKKLLECKENVLYQIIKNVLGREPILPDDAKLFQFIQFEHLPNREFIAYESLVLGELKQMLELEKHKIGFEFTPEMPEGLTRVLHKVGVPRGDNLMPDLNEIKLNILVAVMQAMNQLQIEEKHFSEIFTSTVGVPFSDYYWRWVNKEEVKQEIIKAINKILD